MRAVALAPSRISLRIIPTYAAIFFTIGIALPYWPTWLESRGLSPALIGILLGLGPWVRFAINPSVGRFADRRGIAHRLIALGGLILALGYLGLYVFGTSLVPIAALVLVGAVGFGPMVPLSDSVVLRTEGVDYGPLRAWGSGAFIVASLGGGVLLEGRGADAILFALLSCAVMIGVSALLLPAPARAREPRVEQGSASASAWDTPGFAAFIAIVALLNGSHAALYGFGTLHWRACGISEGDIGLLWSVSVVAEILLFMAGDWLGSRLGSRGLLALAAGGGLLRWTVLGLSPPYALVFAAQLLHALTFASMHLGVMRFVRQRVREGATAHATSLYSAIATGIALGVLMPISGLLYERFEGGAFAAMALLSGLALAASLLWLGRSSDAESRF